MQITEKSAEGLARVYGVTISSADLGQRLDAKVREVAPQVNIKGFRPGKVPVAHVKRMYGKSIMSDMLNELVQEGVDKAVNDNKVRPASQPQVTGLDNLNDVMDLKADLAFNVELDILPEFETMDIKTLELTRPVAEVPDADLEIALAEIAKQSQSFETKKGKAATGDAVICNFVGKIDGEAFEGGTANDATVVLGSGNYIPGFEDQLIGVKAGDERVLNVSFPEEYGVATLAGKAATFDVTVTEVQKAVETPIDDELAKKIGLSDLDALKDALRSNMGSELANLSRQKVKRSLLDALDANHSFDLPAKMVAAEFDAIWAQVKRDEEAGNTDPDDAGKTEDELKAEYRAIAERRVRLGLVLAEIGRTSGVEVKDEEVGRAIQAEAMRFPGQEQAVYQFYQKNPQMVQQLRAPIFEEKVVDFILEMATVTNVTVSREELEAEDDVPAAPKAEAKPAKKKAAKAKADDAPAEASVEAAPKKKPAPKKKAASADDAAG
jgi:trigger factor